MQPEAGFGWMAWTWQTALFFAVIVLLLATMGFWEWRVPGGGARKGVLGLDTTRGDRLFIALLGSAYIHLIWLAWLGKPLWGASAVALVFALLVFRYV